MATLTRIFALIALPSILMACGTTTGPSPEKTAAQAFYDYLSNPGSPAQAEAFKRVAAEDWQSIGNYSGNNKSRDAFAGQMAGFSKLIPDLDWAVQDMHQDGNTVVVRSRATGTPVAPLFGINGEGRRFDVLTIDIHEFEAGKIARSYHVEDWSGGLRQLTSPAVAKATADAIEGQETMKVVMAFMQAMGSGDMETMMDLMADDMVWQNEGDSAIPWIGPWKGKEQILSFLQTFSTGAKTTLWENEDVSASGDTVSIFGKMKFITTHSNQETDEFTFGLRAKVRDGKVVLWNWLENSYDVSRTYHGK
ncbi:MAG: nuclear transport factor 2 family protein [Pseudomonadota bacterium]